MKNYLCEISISYLMKKKQISIFRSPFDAHADIYGELDGGNLSHA